MNKYLRAIFWGILLFSSYHLIRDILQTLGIHSAFTNILHWQHQWCGSICDYVTYPFDLLGIVGSFMVLKKKSMGKIGLIVLTSLIFWGLAVILP